MIVVTVELRDLREKHLSKPGRADVEPGDDVLVSTPNGLETGKVVEGEHMHENDDVEMKIIRILNENDFNVIKENRRQAKSIEEDIFYEISRENLEMKLVKITYTYDRQKLFIYYTAEERVDFRDLIRVLGTKLKVRIQMVQIGVRDAAAIMGGVGICGREVCCHRFLRDIESVNMDMAADQSLSLNPESISGCCGRLQCCLRYEKDFYDEVIKEMPEVGKKVSTPQGKGEVVNINCINKTVYVRLKSGGMSEFELSAITAGVKDKFKKWLK